MLASLSGIKSACSCNKPRCFVNTLLFTKQCYAFPYGSPTSLSNRNFTCSAKQGTKISKPRYFATDFTVSAHRVCAWETGRELTQRDFSYVQKWCLGSSPCRRTTAALRPGIQHDCPLNIHHRKDQESLHR